MHQPFCIKIDSLIKIDNPPFYAYANYDETISALEITCTCKICGEIGYLLVTDLKLIKRYISLGSLPEDCYDQLHFLLSCKEKQFKNLLI